MWDVNQRPFKPAIEIKVGTNFITSSDIILSASDSPLLATGHRGFNNEGAEVKVWDLRSFNNETSAPLLQVKNSQITEPEIPDLAALFFECGGDFHMFNKKINGFLTSGFAALNNLRSYEGSGNRDGIIKTLNALSLILSNMKMSAMAERILILKNKGASDMGLDDFLKEIKELISDLSDTISTTKDILKSNEIFKAQG
jgi:hypothetical protein